MEIYRSYLDDSTDFRKFVYIFKKAAEEKKRRIEENKKLAQKRAMLPKIPPRRR